MNRRLAPGETSRSAPEAIGRSPVDGAW